MISTEEKEKVRPKVKKAVKTAKKNRKKSTKKHNNPTYIKRYKKFDFDDLLIEPEIQTNIITRSEINHRYGAFKGPFGHLPIIAAPMDTVVSLKNCNKFTSNGISVCLPRGEKLNGHGNVGSKMIFNSYSLMEFTENFIAKKADAYPSHVLIDIANGHMSDLVYVTLKAKEYYGKTMQLMVGNVANPETYKLLSEAGADYVRCGIGNGGACITTEQTGIGYPMGSLIKECFDAAKKLPKSKRAKIVADGGMKKYADIIKALALGADYVMIGSLFNKTLESCGRNYFMRIPITRGIANLMYNLGFRIKKEFRGMSTKKVQKKWGNETLKTSEGVVRRRNVEYRLCGWKCNFEHYLKSAMSYTNSRSLEDFVGKAKFNMVTKNSFKRYNK